MALLAIKVSKKVQISCLLEESIAIQVDKYAAFSQAPADDVVNSALEYVFSKDKEFLEYVEKNPNLAAPETLRVKSDAIQQPGPKRGAKERADSAAL